MGEVGWVLLVAGSWPWIGCRRAGTVSAGWVGRLLAWSIRDDFGHLPCRLALSGSCVFTMAASLLPTCMTGLAASALAARESRRVGSMPDRRLIMLCYIEGGVDHCLPL